MDIIKLRHRSQFLKFFSYFFVAIIGAGISLAFIPLIIGHINEHTGIPKIEVNVESDLKIQKFSTESPTAVAGSLAKVTISFSNMTDFTNDHQLFNFHSTVDSNFNQINVSGYNNDNWGIDLNFWKLLIISKPVIESIPLTWTYNIHFKDFGTSEASFVSNVSPGNYVYRFFTSNTKYNVAKWISIGFSVLEPTA